MNPKNKHAAALGSKGGKAGRGKAKARTTEQARAAAQARWAKRQPKSEMPNPEMSHAGWALTTETLYGLEN